MRKVLSFVLTLALVLSSFSMAFAADPVADAKTAPVTTATKGLSDVDGIANQQAIEVCNNLGIVTGNPDGTFQPTKAVTRAEFAAMITRALGVPDSALAGYKTSKFKDTVGYGWAVPYLAFCESKGIMLGDGAGNAMPGKQINTNEAVTMVLRAIGYTANSAELVGVWPSNYVTKAQDLGIYDDVASAVSVDKANAAQMIYNGLTVQKVQVNADGKTDLIVSKGAPVTMLTAGLNCSVRGNGYSVVAYESNAIMNVMPHVGESAKIYENKDGKIVAVADTQSTAITGNFAGDFTTGSFPGFSDDDYDYVMGKDVTTKGAVHFVNNVVKSMADFTSDAAYTLNVKLAGKTIQEVYSIEYLEANQASKITATEIADIKDGSLLGEDFDLDKKDKIVENSFELVGVKSLEDIKANNVVYVYTADKKITRVEVGTAVVEGTVSKVSEKNTKVTVNGTVYKYAIDEQNAAPSACNSGKIKAGDVVKLWLDSDGYIYKCDQTSGKASNYATVIDLDTDKGNFGADNALIKLITADGKVVTYTTDIDGVTGAGILKAAPYSITSGSIMKYNLDKDGYIDDIATTKAINQADKKVSSTGYYAGYGVNSNAVIFTADVTTFAALGTVGAKDDSFTKKDSYSVTTLDKIKGTDGLDAKIVLDDNGKIECMIIDGKNTTNDVYGVVTSKSTGSDGTDTTWLISALVNGKEVEYKANGETAWKKYNDETLYRFDFNANGEVVSPTVSYAKFADFTTLTADNAGTTGGAITTGVGISVNGDVISFTSAGALGQGTSLTVADTAVVYVYDKDDGFVKSSLNTIKSLGNKLGATEKRDLLFFITDAKETSVADIVVLFPQY